MKHTDTKALACKLEEGVFSTQEEAQYHTIRQKMQAAAQDFKELPDGYAIRFPMETSLFMTVSEYITLERQCCPFFNFSMELNANSQTFWLALTGDDGVKDFLKTELGITSA